MSKYTGGTPQYTQSQEKGNGPGKTLMGGNRPCSRDIREAAGQSFLLGCPRRGGALQYSKDEGEAGCWKYLENAGRTILDSNSRAPAWSPDGKNHVNPFRY